MNVKEIERVVRVSFTSGNRIAVFVDTDDYLYKKRYIHKLTKQQEQWVLTLIPVDDRDDTKGTIFRKRTQQDVWAWNKVGVTAKELPPFFGITSARALHLEDGTIVIRISKNLQPFTPRMRSGNAKRDRRHIVLERAINDINRCIDEIPELVVSVKTNGKISAEIVTKVVTRYTFGE